MPDTTPNTATAESSRFSGRLPHWVGAVGDGCAGNRLRRLVDLAAVAPRAEVMQKIEILAAGS